MITFTHPPSLNGVALIPLIGQPLVTDKNTIHPGLAQKKPDSAATESGLMRIWGSRSR
jgi:hypothetical protein